MKKLSILLVILLLTKLLTAQSKGEYKVIEVPSPSLEKSILDAKKVQKVGIYLPPDYQNSKKNYPVLYYLNGFTVSPGQYPPMPWIDSLMSHKLVEDMIFVDIAGRNTFKGCMYANSPVTGNWEDFVTKDLIDYIDKNYRTLAKRESRGIAGHSMGGAGTFNISLKHADLYSVAYVMSPAIAPSDSILKYMFENENKRKIIEQLSEKMKNVSPEKFEAKLQKELLSFDDDIDWLLGYGSAFSPDLSQPLKISFPYIVSKDGKISYDKEKRKIWTEGFGNLDEKVKRYKDNLLKYRHYSLDCGYSDFLFYDAEFLSNILINNRIPFSVHFYDGDHVNKVGEQLTNKVLPTMSAYLLKE